jgi:hypothetical protein
MACHFEGETRSTYKMYANKKQDSIVVYNLIMDW